MATQQISMLANVNPDATGRCWMEPYDVVATNDVWKGLVFRFKDPGATEAHGLYGWLSVPQNYVGTAVVIPVWTSTATTGNCYWRITYRAISGDNTESMDQTSNQEQVRQVDVAPGAANRRLTPSITLTSANFAAGDTVEFLFERQSNSSDDTMAADAVLFDLLFQYADT